MDFETFRRKLADAVTVAINSGAHVSPNRDIEGRCPLGCFTEIAELYRAPTGEQFSRVTGGLLTAAEASAFGAGFDGELRRYDDDDARFYNLGKLYRERFSEKK